MKEAKYKKNAAAAFGLSKTYYEARLESAPQALYGGILFSILFEALWTVFDEPAV